VVFWKRKTTTPSTRNIQSGGHCWMLLLYTTRIIRWWTIRPYFATNHIMMVFIVSHLTYVWSWLITQLSWHHLRNIMGTVKNSYSRTLDNTGNYRALDRSCHWASGRSTSNTRQPDAKSCWMWCRSDSATRHWRCVSYDRRVFLQYLWREFILSFPPPPFPFSSALFVISSFCAS